LLFAFFSRFNRSAVFIFEALARGFYKNIKPLSNQGKNINKKRFGVWGRAPTVFFHFMLFSIQIF